MKGWEKALLVLAVVIVILIMIAYAFVYAFNAIWPNWLFTTHPSGASFTVPPGGWSATSGVPVFPRPMGAHIK